MPSPTKKRKLNNGSKASSGPSRGLEYFFSKQRQNVNERAQTPDKEVTSEASTELTDEELARKLQAEWDQEAVSERQQDRGDSHSTPASQRESSPIKEKTPIPDLTPITPSSTVPPTLTKPKTPTDKPKNTLSLQSAGVSEDTTSSSIPLDESPLTFEPSKYIPQLQEHWESEGGDASYALLTRCFVIANGTTSRIKIVDTIVNFLRILIELDPSSVLPAVGVLPFE